MSTVDSNSPAPSPLKQVGKNFLYLLVIFILSGFTSYLVAQKIDETFPTQNRWIKLRIKGALDFLNTHESENSIYVWGTSEVESGLKPKDLEKALCPAGVQSPRVFNLGFRDFNPFQMHLFLNHWQRPKKVPLLNIVKINPVHLTKKSAKRLHTSVDEVWADLASPQEILQAKQWTHRNKLNMLWSKFLLAGVAPGSLQIRLIRDSLVLYRNQETLDRRSLWGDSKTHPLPAWDLELQGFHDRSKGIGSSEEYVRELKFRQSQEPELSSSIKYQNAKTGLNNPVISPKLREQYVRWIKELKLRSSNLILFYTPEHPDARSPESKNRFAAFFKKVKKQTGVNVINLSSDPVFQSPDAYYDVHHFTEKGEEEFIKVIANMIRDEISPQQLAQFCNANE